MTKHAIRCPNCRCEFELSALVRADMEAEVRVEVAKQFEGRANAIQAAADTRIREKEGELAEARGKIVEAERRETDLLKQKRELAEREQRLELDIERRLDVEIPRIREQEASAAQQRFAREAEREEEQRRLRDEEHRQKIAGLEKTIAELQRKMQQGSQQVQGEAQEVVLRDLLEGAFPVDGIQDVPKGVNGADLVHAVRSPDGRDCGSIVWESKRTRVWSDGWLPKLRDDQREAGGACAVIVSQCLPSDVRHFGLKEGVWVCAPAYAVPLAAALRAGLIEVATARRAAEGSGQKMQLLYDYMTGTEFRNRVEGLVEAFVEMQDELASEKRTTLTRWKRHEKLMDRALENITALCGDLQGIAGRKLGDLLPAALDAARALPEADDRYDVAAAAE